MNTSENYIIISNEYIQLERINICRKKYNEERRRISDENVISPTFIVQIISFSFRSQGKGIFHFYIYH